QIMRRAHRHESCGRPLGHHEAIAGAARHLHDVARREALLLALHLGLERAEADIEELLVLARLLRLLIAIGDLEEAEGCALALVPFDAAAVARRATETG